MKNYNFVEYADEFAIKMRKEENGNFVEEILKFKDLNVDEFVDIVRSIPRKDLSINIINYIDRSIKKGYISLDGYIKLSRLRTEVFRRIVGYKCEQKQKNLKQNNKAFVLGEESDIKIKDVNLYVSLDSKNLVYMQLVLQADNSEPEYVEYTSFNEQEQIGLVSLLPDRLLNNNTINYLCNSSSVDYSVPTKFYSMCYDLNQYLDLNPAIDINKAMENLKKENPCLFEYLNREEEFNK